jgi:hypothetical protein
MKSLWHLLQQATGTGTITEEKIRKNHTLYIDVWDKSSTPPEQTGIRQALHRLRHRWVALNFSFELHTVGATTREHDPESNKPVAHSSLNLVEGFVKMKAIFKPPDYSVYRVSGNSHWIEPLLGTDSIIVLERITREKERKEPLQAGDVIVFRLGDKRILHRIIEINTDNGFFRVTGTGPIPTSSVESRLAAVVYTQEVKEPQAREDMPQHTLFVDVWDETLFRPTHSDKPTPHSSLRLSGREKRRIRQVFPYPKYQVWDNVPNTNSMEPFIDTNTVVVFETITETTLRKQPLQVGDIISWRKAKWGFTHRIIGASESGKNFYVKGDNNRYGDMNGFKKLIPVSSIMTRVVSIIYTRQIQIGD